MCVSNTSFPGSAGAWSRPAVQVQQWIALRFQALSYTLSEHLLEYFQKACWGSSYCRLGLLIHAVTFFSFHCQLQMFFLSFSLGKLSTIMTCYHFICNGLFLRQLQSVSLLWFWQNYAFPQQYFWYKHSLSSKKSLLLSCVKGFVSCVSNVNLLWSITTLTWKHKLFTI